LQLATSRIACYLISLRAITIASVIEIVKRQFFSLASKSLECKRSVEVSVLHSKFTLQVQRSIVAKIQRFFLSLGKILPQLIFLDFAIE